MSATRQRQPRIADKRITNDAKGQACSICGLDDGTTVNAHCNDMIYRGIGMKAPDCLTAWACNLCHDEIDGRRGKLTKEEKRAMWDRGFKKTVVERFRLGFWVTA